MDSPGLYGGELFVQAAAKALCAEQQYHQQVSKPLGPASVPTRRLGCRRLPSACRATPLACLLVRSGCWLGRMEPYPVPSWGIWAGSMPDWNMVTKKNTTTIVRAGTDSSFMARTNMILRHHANIPDIKMTPNPVAKKPLPSPIPNSIEGKMTTIEINKERR